MTSELNFIKKSSSNENAWKGPFQAEQAAGGEAEVRQAQLLSSRTRTRGRQKDGKTGLEVYWDGGGQEDHQTNWHSSRPQRVLPRRLQAKNLL